MLVLCLLFMQGATLVDRIVTISLAENYVVNSEMVMHRTYSDPMEFL